MLQRAQKYTIKPIVHTRDSGYHKDSIGETKILDPAYDELRMSPESKLSNPYYNNSPSPVKISSSSQVYQSYGGSSIKPKASSSKNAHSGNHSKQNSILADESYLALISGRQPEGDEYSPEVGKGDAQNLLLQQIEDLRRENEHLKRDRKTQGPTKRGSARSGLNEPTLVE